MLEVKHEKVAEDDPRRCQHVFEFGQCQFKSLDGTDRCATHQGPGMLMRQQHERIRNYRLAKWRNRVGEFADNENVKSLREEIGILRMVLEETLNKCEDASTLLIYSTRISDLVMKIEKIVVSCNKLESHLNVTLDKAIVLGLATRIVEIIGKHISDAMILDIISDDIVEAFTEITTIASPQNIDASTNPQRVEA